MAGRQAIELFCHEAIYKSINVPPPVVERLEHDARNELTDVKKETRRMSRGMNDPLLPVGDH